MPLIHASTTASWLALVAAYFCGGGSRSTTASRSPSASARRARPHTRWTGECDPLAHG